MICVQRRSPRKSAPHWAMRGLDYELGSPPAETSGAFQTDLPPFSGWQNDDNSWLPGATTVQVHSFQTGVSCLLLTLLWAISVMSGGAPGRAPTDVSHALSGTQAISSPKWNYNLFRKWMQAAAVGDRSNTYGQLAYCFFHISPVALTATEWPIWGFELRNTCQRRLVCSDVERTRLNSTRLGGWSPDAT